ncbi:MAG: 4a-hydroxytetrahydrobiopterin dehydratase [Planctomycetota bacterium]|jgi:4a-hydroxytetrahydrobiopterin dehydratase
MSLERTNLSHEEVDAGLQSLNEGGAVTWVLQDAKLRKEIVFEDFDHAFGFMVKVAAIAEEMDHHPDWSNVYHKVTIALHTHDVGGITEFDFELARRIDALLDPS